MIINYLFSIQKQKNIYKTIQHFCKTNKKLEIKIDYLQKNITEQQVGQFLNQFTQVTQIKFIKDAYGKFTGTAFAKLTNEDSLKSALSQQFRNLDGKNIKISQALTKEELEILKQTQKNDPQYQQNLIQKQLKKKCRLFLGNLHHSVTEQNIKDFFKEIQIEQVQILRKNGESRGFGYIQLNNEIEVQEAFKKNGQTLNGKMINIELQLRNNI